MLDIILQYLKFYHRLIDTLHLNELNATRACLAKQKVKNDIDLKVDVLKEEIERARDNLHEECDRYFDTYMS